MSKRLIELTGAADIFALYDVSSVTGTIDGGLVSQWDDLSGNNRHLLKDPKSGNHSITYAERGIAGLPSILFSGGQFETANNEPTPPSRSITVILSFRFLDSNGASHHILGQGYNNLWRLIRASATNEIIFQAVNSMSPSITFEHNEDYVLVARGAGYTREIKLYNMRGELLDSNVYSNTNV